MDMRTHINKAFAACREYLAEIWSRKVRLAIGVGISFFLFLISWRFLFEGINKRFFVFTALSLLTGVFFVLPRIKNFYLVFGAVVCYLMFVPARVCWRIELPNYDLSDLMPAAQTVNIIIILALFCVLLLVFQRTGIAFAVGNLFLLCLALINHYCVIFRGSGLSAFLVVLGIGPVIWKKRA